MDIQTFFSLLVNVLYCKWKFYLNPTALSLLMLRRQERLKSIISKERGIALTRSGSARSFKTAGSYTSSFASN